MHIQNRYDSSTPRNPSADETLLVDDDALKELRRKMLSFATLQLSDACLAEDVVQETFVGALRNAGSFRGRAALKTWIFAILKNKIADQLRQYSRLSRDRGAARDEEDLDNAPPLFDSRGCWLAGERPRGWGDPEEAIREQQFWRVFEMCLENLPPNHARVFMMREFVGLDNQEICSAVEITVGNLNVMMHRSRICLRRCLEQQWIVEAESTC